MASSVDICNRALGKLGAATIISLEQDDPKAVALGIAYPLVRDAELRRHRWRFSLARTALSASPTAPEFGFAHRYPLPSDCLRIVQVGERDAGPNLSDYKAAPTEWYSVEGRSLLTDLPAPLAVRYISRVEDTGLYDASFVEALASRLAYEVCYRITQNNEREDRCLRDYRMAIMEAVRANALEVAPGDVSDDTWVMARLG